MMIKKIEKKKKIRIEKIEKKKVVRMKTKQINLQINE